jgi:hypothetical protein
MEEKLKRTGPTKKKKGKKKEPKSSCAFPSLCLKTIFGQWSISFQKLLGGGGGFDDKILTGFFLFPDGPLEKLKRAQSPP